MWVLEHLAIGYVLWSGWTRFREHRPPTGHEFWLVCFGALLPDLVDKPLAWTYGVLPAGRSLAHSLLTATLVIAMARRFAARNERGTLATAFGLGWVSHILADTVFPLLTGQYAYTYFVLWPLLPLPYYDTSRSLLAEVLFRVPISFRGRHLLVALFTLFLWVGDGMPGTPGRSTERPPVRDERESESR